MSLLRSLPLTPIALGAAVYLLQDGPASVRIPVLERLRASLSPEQVVKLVDFLKSAFYTTAAFDAVYYVNSYLNNLALNNFRGADSSRWNWAQEIAVVTGGASGFGKSFTLELAKKGVRVATLDVSPTPPEFKGNSLITSYKCDVTDPAAVKEVANQIKKQIGNPSILINNAGIAQSHSVLKTSPEWLQKIIGVNVMHHYYTAQEFLPAMIEKKKGHIVTIASVASFVASPGMVDYATSKAAVQAFHEGLRSELRTFHDAPEIHMTIVHPKWALTPMVAKYAERLQKGGQDIMDPKVVVDAVIKQIFSCRGGQLVLGSQTSVIRRFRFLPTWLTTLALRPIETGIKREFAAGNL